MPIDYERVSPIGHKLTPVSLLPQGVDAVPQRQQRTVDIGTLHKPHTSILSGGRSGFVSSIDSASARGGEIVAWTSGKISIESKSPARKYSENG